MTENIFDKFDIGDLIKHTTRHPKPVHTYGVVSAIRTHETPILPERKVEVTIRYINHCHSKVHYGNRNSDHLTKLIIIAKGKTNDGIKR
tara:strand:+ start:1757 stop:2023 length:267 start_codon:yes stop_codon:yes gene_type:complete